MSTYPHNSFAPLLDAFNTERAPFAPWFDKIEIYRLEYWEHSKGIRFLPPFESDHAHRFWEIHLFTDGEQIYEIDGECLAMHAGEILMIPPLAQHRQRISEKGVTKFVLMLHTPKDLPEPFCSILREMEAQKLLHFSYDAALLTPFDHLFRHGDLQPPRGIHILAACTFLFLDGLFRQLQTLLPDTNAPVLPHGHSDAMLPDDVIDYIENHISHRVTAEETAQHFFMSARHLNRRLLTSCGVTFGELSDRIRSDFAKQLLLHTDLSIEKIGEKIGFSDAGSFARFFKRMADISPSAFRKTKGEHFHE